MPERNFRLLNAKCCGSCAELKDDDISGHYYCDIEGDADFDPQEGQEWQYVCNCWRKIKRKIGKTKMGG